MSTVACSTMASEDVTMDCSLSELPTTWDDRRLLRHDPFKDLCPLRDLSDDLDYRVRTKAYVKENEEFVRAFIRWCLMTFQPLNGECPANMPKPDDFVSDPVYWNLFVDVFYCLYKRNQNAALLFIDKERERLGYRFSWTPAAPGRRKRPSQFTVRASITVGSTESNGDIIDSLRLRENITPSSEEIAAACEKFLKNLSVEDPSASGDGCRRSIRKAAPSTTCLREQAQREKEHADSERHKHLERKRRKKNKAKAHKYANCNKQVPVEPKEVILESNSLDPNQLGHIKFIETIAVNNEQTATSVQATTRDVALVKLQDHAHSHISQPWPMTRDEVKTGKKKRKQSERTESDCLLSRTKARITTSSAFKKQKKGQYTGISEENLPSAERITKRNDEMVSKVRAISKIAYSQNICARPGRNNASAGSAPVSSDSSTIERHHALLSIAGLPTEPSLDSQTPRSASSDETLVDHHSPGEDSKMCSENSAISKTMEVQNLILERLWQRKMVESPAKSHMQPTMHKPPLPEGRRPSIWAPSRQALCETTSWFRCYHGGVYFSDGKAHGYLLGGFSSQRDMFHHDGRLIISHGGGKQLDGSPGQRDQDASVRSLLYNYREHHPLVLLADNNYALFPFDLGEMMYVVLGLYWIVDAWAEIDVSYVDGKLDARIKYKFAFQYCEGQGPPWWLGNSEVKSPTGAKDSNEPDPASVPERVDSSQEEASSSNCSRMNQHSCRKCGKSSSWIYKQGWMCFRPDCSEFFRIEGEEFSGLDYDEAFLQLRPDPGFGKIDLNILSSVPMPDASADSIYSVRGWFCCKCGQLCPRERWECWECARCREIFPKEIELPIRDYKEFSQQELDLKHYKVYKIHDGSGITVTTEKWSSPQNSDRGIRYIFHLPDNLGRIHLMKGNAISNERANTLFRKYQEDARDRSFLRRYPLRFHHARGRMLTNYFSHNAGVPYEYAVTTNVTDPFDRAPASVNDALQLIKNRVSTIVQEGADFNEILTAAYMAEQKMSYHTDDESGLGPIVASLSLGSIAFMHFRNRKIATKARVDKQLTVVLRHGDVLVMEGAAIQKSYEHSVVPVNFRIAATARYIYQG